MNLAEIEAFWDPASQLLIFRIPPENPGTSLDGREIEYGVFTGTVEEPAQLLVAVIEARNRTSFSAVRLPQGHFHICIRPLFGGDPIDDVAIALVHDADIHWEHRVAFALGDGKRDAIQFRNYPGILNEEDLVGLSTSNFRNELIWMVSHRQVKQSATNAFRIGPTMLLWPIENRIKIEALRMVDPAASPLHDPATARSNRPAIQKAVATENTPRPRLRLYINPEAPPDVHRRLSVVHVMHQRRLLERLNEERRQSRPPKPQVQPLSLAMIRKWLRDTLSEDGHFEAVESDESLLVVPFAEDIMTMAQRDIDGISISVAKDSSFVDIDYFGAAYGDDIGVASASDAGDLTVNPKDPGGASNLRLFRVASDRLRPLQIDGAEEIVREIIREAARKGVYGGEGSQGAPDGTRWARFTQKLGLPAGTEHIAQIAPASLRALMLVAWAEVDQPVGDKTTSVEFQRFRRAPALFTAFHHFSDLMQRNTIRSEAAQADIALPRQVAEGFGAADLVPRTATADEWATIWRVLRDPEAVRGLVTARISLDRIVLDPSAIRRLADEMANERRIADAQETSLDRKIASTAAALQEYLDRRRKGVWSTFSEVAELARVIREQEQDDPLFADSTVSPSAPTQDTRDLPTLLATVERLLELAKRVSPPPKEINVGNLIVDLEVRKKTGRIDRPGLRRLEQILKPIAEPPIADKLVNELTAALEGWAGIPNFAEQMRPRLRRGLDDEPRRRREAIQDLLDRVRAPRAGSASHEFERHRRGLAARIETKLSDDGRIGSDAEQVKQDLENYGDILLHHRAWITLTDLASKIEQAGNMEGDAGRLRQRMTTWPMHAAEIWDEARELADKLSVPASNQFENSLKPPAL